MTSVGAYRTGGAEAVVLAVGALAYAAESVALYNALESFTFGHAYPAARVQSY